MPSQVGRSSTVDSETLLVRRRKPSMMIVHWPTLADKTRKRIYLFVWTVFWLLATFSSLSLFLAILHSLVAVVIAFIAGAATRCLGQRWNVKRLSHSGKVAEMATFSFDGHAVFCVLDEARTSQYLHAWKWRIAASVVAGGVCLAVLHTPALAIHLLPAWAFTEHWLKWTIESFSKALPAFVVAFFLLNRWPKRRWINQARRTVQARADCAFAAIMANRELDGLGAGVDCFWLELKVDRRGEYRAALNRRLHSHTAEAVLQPLKTAALLESLTELARQDLRLLYTAVNNCRQIELQMNVIQTLASIFLDPANELTVVELRSGFGLIHTFAENRQWDDLERYMASFQSRLEAAQERICRNASRPPPTTLVTGNNPYRLLGVAPTTPTPTIHKLWLRLAHLYHPDMNGSAFGSAKMAELNAAYAAIMKDREKEHG